MKYRVQIPMPSSKRMIGNGKIVIVRNVAPIGSHPVEHEIDSQATNFEFEMPDRFDWHKNTNYIDGDTFSVHIKYTNASGTRMQEIELVPEKIDCLVGE